MCNCGGTRLPNSVIVRMEAARLAASMTNAGTTQFGTHFANVHAAMLGEVKEADLDKVKEPASTLPDDVSTSAQRNAFLNHPVSVLLSLNEGAVNAMEDAGIVSVGALCQWNTDQLMNHAALTDAGIRAVISELKARGLRVGMSTEQLAHWIIKGTVHAAQEAV